MKKLIYTFFGYSKHSSKLLYKTELTGWDKRFLPRDNATKKLVSLVDSYDLIVGIADHNKNATKNRFDPKYVNKYGTHEIITEGAESYLSNIELHKTEDLYIYKSTSNGPCNRTAYLVMHEIATKNFQTKFGFLHLTKSITSQELVDLLETITRSYTF